MGNGGRNNRHDVQLIQGGLNRVPIDAGGPFPRLTTDGVCSGPTVDAIRRFQTAFFGSRPPDGRVDVNGQTYRGLARQIHLKHIDVALANLVLEAFEDGHRIHHFPCVPGDADHPTDRGTFSILRKNNPYRSRKYDVDMNYAMFFTNDGKAIHQYHGFGGLALVRTMREVSDWFGSHGCVRLDESAARTLYNWTPVGTRLVIF